MSGLYFISFFQRVAIPGTLFNDLQIDFAASAAAITALSSIYLYVYSSLQLFVGMLADKYGGIKIILISGTLLFLGSMIFPLSNHLWALYLSRALVGLGASAMYLCIIKETDSLFGAKNFSMLLGIFCMIGYGGGLFATKPFRALVDLMGSWRIPLVIIAVACLVLIGAVFRMGRGLKDRHLHAPKGRSSIEKFKHVFSNLSIYPMLTSNMINFSIYFSFQAIIGPKFLQDFLGLAPSAASKYTFVMMLFTMTMILTSGGMSRIIGNRRKPFIVFASCLSCSAVIVLLCGTIFHLPPGVFMLAYIMLALTSGFFPVTAALMKELNSRDTTAIAVGVQNTASQVAVAVAANLIGFVLDCYKPATEISGKAIIYPESAYRTLFTVMLCFSAIAVASSFFCKETHGKECL